MSFPENVILVVDGEVEKGMWGIAKDLMAKDDHVILLSELVGCSLVSDRHEEYQTGIGRVAGGVIGAVLLGPIGAAGGLLAGGKRRVDETIVLCSLSDGRSFSGEVSQLTAAKLQQIASRNSQSQYISKSENRLLDVAEPVALGDSIECPMCAEVIKARAKICRFCGFNIQEEKERKANAISSDPTVESTHDIKLCIANFRLAIEYEEEISDLLVYKVLESFSEMIKKYPDKNYRNVAEFVKNDLDIEYKMVINDLIREGFPFLRACPTFEVVGDLIVVRKK